MNDEKQKLNQVMNNPNFIVRCRFCKSVLISKQPNQLKKCKCGRISIDGGKNKTERRLVGDLDFVELCE